MNFGLAQAGRCRSRRASATLRRLATIAFDAVAEAFTTAVERIIAPIIWSLGVVLYEMVSGLLPFRGEYNQAITYSITSEEPEPLTALRTGVPMELEWLVAKCLAKKAEERYQNAADLIVDLANLGKKIESGKSTILRPSSPLVSSGGLQQPAPVQEGSARAGRAEAAVTAGVTGSGVPSPDGGPEVRRSTAGPVRHEGAAPATTRERIYMAAAALLLVGLLAVSFVHFGETTAPPPVRRFAFSPENFRANVPGRAVISPNGQHIAYLAGSNQPSIWIRDLQREEPREMPGTEGAERPFWSPDSQFIGFAAEGELRKIHREGGTSITLCRLPDSPFRAGTWSLDGEVVAFAAGGPASLYQVSARGGETELLPFDNARRGLSNPHFLPAGGNARPLLFEAARNEPDRELAVGDPETGEWTVLGRGAYPVSLLSKLAGRSRDGC